MKGFLPGRSYPTGDGEILVLPADRFVVRLVPLSPAVPAADQVELAVEASAPLPLAQLQWGYLTSADRGNALVWTACRRHVEAGEAGRWDAAAAVLPASLALCHAPSQRPAIVLHDTAAALSAAAWAAEGDLPVLILARPVGTAGRTEAADELVADLRRRTGLWSASLFRLEGGPRVDPKTDGRTMRLCGENWQADFAWAELAGTDLRARDELGDIRRRLRRDRLLGGASVAAAILIAAAALLDLGGFAGRRWLAENEAAAAKRAAAVEEIQAAHALAHRLGELSGQRLPFMEMLDALNRRRPAGILFTRAVSAGRRTLEINARTANADEARQYESDLRGLPGLRGVRISNLQTRDGHTDFLLTAEFAPNLPGEAGMP